MKTFFITCLTIIAVISLSIYISLATIVIDHHYNSSDKSLLNAIKADTITELNELVIAEDVGDGTFRFMVDGQQTDCNITHDATESLNSENQQVNTATFILTCVDSKVPEKEIKDVE